MLQHWLLMMVAPPLLLLGAPVAPLVRGLPRVVRREIAAPLLASPSVRRSARALVHPVTGWLALAVATWLWHLPSAYELALRSPAWHRAEHGCFLGAALLFWWPVILPWPARAAWPRAAVIPYLVLADLQNTAFSALFTFSDRAFYATHEAASAFTGSSALSDQAAAGALMWVLGSVAFLVPLGFVVREMLAPPAAPLRTSSSRPRSRVPGAAGFDVLRLRRVGRWLRSLTLRRGVQIAALALAGAVLADGLLGPSMSPMNLAGVVPWIWWRGLLVAGLLGAGSVLCFSCPFMLVRDVVRRWLPARRRWPASLRSKWLAATLLAALLAASEIFGLWDDPRATAVLVLAYFCAVIIVDGIFRGASFCKYVCPIGQFQFIGAAVSPLTVKARAAAICAACESRDCIRGGPGGRGCEMDLFVPAKVGNLDCTLCLDCVRACPHDNVALLPSAPDHSLNGGSQRPSPAHLARRLDLAALALVFVAGAFVSAAAMVGPVGQAIARLAAATGSKPVAEALTFAAGLAAVPALAITACSRACWRLGRAVCGRRALAAQLSQALVPLGVGMWSAHFLFHFVTAAASLVPVAQRVAQDLGLRLLGAPDWRLAHAAPAAETLLGLEILLLDLGLLVTLYTGWRISEQVASAPRRALAGFIPFALLAAALWALGLFVVSEPMPMRGTMVHG